MKRFNYYLSLMLLLVFTAACSDEFDQPPMVIPHAQHTANISIAEFKAKHWQDARNYIDTVFEDEIIHGWVTSSDESGNIYKCLYIMDESGEGLAISINQNSLYNNYRFGQEVVIPMKGYFVGKYNGMQQLGYPQYYDAGSAWEATFLPQAMWESMVELNAFPDASKVDTLVVSIDEFAGKTDPETQRKYQGRLVRIKGVVFEDKGDVFAVQPSSDGKNGSTNRNITDESGNTLIVRNSGYADFRGDTLPEGEVDVIGLLGMYGTTWQLYLRSADDVIAGGSGGTKNSPYKIADAISMQNSGERAWFGGYAVGAVAPEVTSVSSNADIEWKAPTTLENTIVLADDPECKDYTKCVIIPLPQGSLARTDLNLRENPNVYKTFVTIKATPATFMGSAGLIEPDNYVRDVAYTKLEESFDTGIPGEWTNLKLSGSNKWEYYSYTSGANTINCARVTGYKGSNPPYDMWLITPKLDFKNAKSQVLSFTSEVNNYGNIVLEVYLLDTNDPNTATVKVKLDPVLPAKPTSGAYSAWVSSGNMDLSQWNDGCYYIGFNYYAPADPDNNYTTWCIDDVKFGVADPPIPAPKNLADFATMGKATSTIGNYKSQAGWAANNCSLLSGGTGSNPVFEFIGYTLASTTEFAIAPTMNGGTDKVGTIVSPTLHNGLTKLRFNYGAAYSGTVISFRVDVKQGGQVVKSWTVTENPMTQKYAYSFEGDCSVNGDFTIEFTNLCPSNSTGNKDRFSVWNVNWDNAQ